MQLDVPGVAHPPAPSQCETGENVDPVHDAVPHETAVDACWQPPPPLHAPVLPHGGLATQPAETCPAATFAQLPTPLMLHAWQFGQLAVPQQTPSVQWPLMHWLDEVHETPLALSAQFPD
jgi:hypothetical protein